MPNYDRSAFEKIVHPDHKNQNAEIYELLKKKRITLAEAEVLHEELLTLVASVDHMTGLDNQRAALVKLRLLMEYCKANKAPLTVMYLDADNFKLINDKLGHDIGDKAIKSLAQAIERASRHSDLQARLKKDLEPESSNGTARMGGDEFFVAFPGATLEDMLLIFSRIQVEFKTKFVNSLPRGIKSTISGGAAEYNPKIDMYNEDLLRRSESAMRNSKVKGKGQLTLCRYNQKTNSLKYELL